MSRLLMVLFFFSVVACGGKEKPPKGEPGDAVRRFFAAVEEYDCDALKRSVGGALAKRVEELGCEKSLHEFDEGDVRLERVIEVKKDGRASHGVIVRVVLSAGPSGARKDKETITKVNVRDGRWVLVDI